jgi:hypothetical protein
MPSAYLARPAAKIWACHIGVLMYASSTLRVDLSQRFAALRFYSETARRLQASPSLWEVPLPHPLPPAVEKELTEWTEALLANAPVPIPTFAPDTPSRLICVDASGWGFAALHVDLAFGHAHVHQEGWYQIPILQGKCPHGTSGRETCDVSVHSP